MVCVSRLPRPVTEDWDWQLRGACRDRDNAPFFHPDNERGTARARRDEQAKAVCRTCPVIQRCLEHALAVAEPYGVWGGMGEDERRHLLTARRHAARRRHVA